MQAPKTIYLADYKPSSFEVDTIDLTVDIWEESTIVTSVLKIHKRPELKGQKLNLELNGEGMELLHLKFNGKELGTHEFQVSNEKLVLLNLDHDEFVLEIQNKIDPKNNHALEGFYQSGPQLCTQCEPEGFRRITYFIDRPDVMAKYTTKLIGDKTLYPFLLSNGNRVGKGELPDNRHWVKWEDPFKKPSYLFAMVAGDFDVARDFFITKSKRRIELEIYVDKGNLKKTPHAMKSLKESMRWDEEKFGLEYDLDIYMIVAVDSFNMGAMENKGLNIFNSTFTLADETSATDHDFQNIEAVIGHEYFHNWTGNRVTCRDWFQLTLKEGLTVFRDQEFSSDMLSRAVKRVEDVRLLKDAQFAEDAGPLSHPIRPSSYIEINNFYTRTVYEKGAEIIRMIQTLIGREKFRLGMDKYFELFDGKAVTTEDFLFAMEKASGRDLSQFKNWYSRPGTPTLKISKNNGSSDLELVVEQKYPPTTLKVPEGNILHMPFLVGVIDPKTKTQKEVLLNITKMTESFKLPGDKDSILSLNRGFSAPVHVDFSFKEEELLLLMGHDQDPYCKYEATQKIYEDLLKRELHSLKMTGKVTPDLPQAFVEAMGALLLDKNVDASFLSYLLELPSENSLSQEMMAPDFEAIHKSHLEVRKKIGLAFFDWFMKTHERLSKNTAFELTPKAFGDRALKNQALTYLVASGHSLSKTSLKNHYEKASNMTEEIHGLTLYIKSGVELQHEAVVKFYQKWRNDSLVMLKWFGALAAFSSGPDVISKLTKLENDPLYKSQVPNYLRSLYLQFAKTNLVSFHDVSGRGYDFLAERIIKIDAFNPQVASRGASAFALINKLDSDRKEKMKMALDKIMKTKISKDTFEVVSKYLSQ